MNNLEKYNKIRSNWLFIFKTLDTKLIELNKLTEKDFLDLCMNFQRFSGQSSELSKNAIAAANFLSSKEIVDAIEDLYELLEKIKGYFQFCENGLSTNITILDKIFITIGKIETPLNSFNKLIKKLRIMRVSIRIENSLISNDTINFDTFSSEVKIISNTIDDNLNKITYGTLALKKVISDTLVASKMLKIKQYSNVHKILKDTNSCLSKLILKNEKSSDTAKKIIKLIDEVNTNIGKIVESIQFHDITWQKLINVNKAIKENIEILSDENKNTKDAYVETVMSVSGICELEAAQTQYALDEIMSSMNNIVDNMNGIVNVNQIMLNETDNMLLISSEEKEVFLKPIEKGIQSVTSKLNESSKANFDLDVAMNSSAQMVKKMSKFVEDTEEIGLRMKLLAFNGLVNATHLGHEGAGLSVLAAEIQKISNEAHQHIGVVSNVLNDIISSAKGLRIGLESDDDQIKFDNIINGMIDDLSELLVTFCNVNEKVFDKFKEIDSTGHILLRDMQSIIQNIDIHKKCEMELNHVVQLLNEIHIDSQEIVPSSNKAPKNIRLEKLKDRYCMYSERKIHNKFTGVNNEVEQSADDDIILLDDNIELF